MVEVTTEATQGLISESILYILIMNTEFEWDPRKAALNKTKHGIAFDQAITAFDDLDAIELYDAAHSQNEERYRLIGLSDIGILLVVYTVRHAEHVHRIISARKATRYERKDYDDQQGKN